MNLNLGYDRCGRFSDIIHKIGLDYIEYKDNMFIKNEDVSKIYEYRKLCHEHLTSYFENDVINFVKSIYDEEVFESEPNYFYVFGYNREKEISKLAENYRFSEEETRRIYDCGYIKMKFSK